MRIAPCGMQLRAPLSELLDRARLRALDGRQAARRGRRRPSRFASEAKLSRAAGVAPIPVSSGKTNRHRLDRGGNRQINTTIHRIAVTRLRCHPETQDYIARKRAEGKTTKKRCAASNATSPAASGTCSSRPTPTKEHRHHPSSS